MRKLVSVSVTPWASHLEVATDEPVEVGDIRLVEVGDVRDHGRRQRHPLGDRAAKVREWLALDRAPLLEAGQRWRLQADRRQRLRRATLDSGPRRLVAFGSRRRTRR